ncbi:MAG: phosphatase PAP2 family protein [Bacteroidetes bacterium]|nr:phosphatase PAP2 family protein [Bacteroidota bacterium]
MNLFARLKSKRSQSFAWSGLLLVFLSILGDVIHEVLWEQESGFDDSAFKMFNKLTNPNLTWFMESLSFFGSFYFLFPAYLVLISVLLVRKRPTTAVDAGIIGITSPLLIAVLKHFFKRERPRDSINLFNLDYSFPSGHTTASFIFSGLLIYLILNAHFSNNRKAVWCVLLFLSSMLIGVSRIYLRKHFASDVIAGFCIGYSWLFLLLRTLGKLKRNKMCDK